MNRRLSSRLVAALALFVVVACDPKKEDKPTAKAEDKSGSKDEGKGKDKADAKADAKAEAKADAKADDTKADDVKADDAKADDAKADDAKADDAKADEPETAEDGVLEDGTDQEGSGPVFAEGDLDLSHEKIGDLHLGMSGADLEKMLGKPKEKSKIIELGATGDLVGTWSFPGKGITAEMVFDDRKGTNPSISALTANESCAFALPWGLKIGSTRAEVEKVYGKNFDPDMTTKETFIAGSIYGGSMYDFEDGKVVRLFIGAGAE